MKVRVFTDNQLPRSRLAGGGKQWIENMTMERLAYLASLDKCLVEVQACPGPDTDPDVKLWVTVYGADGDVTALIRDGGGSV